MKIQIQLILLLSLYIVGCASMNRPQIINKEKPCQSLPLKIKWKAPQQLADANDIVRPIKGYKVYLKESSKKHFREYITVNEGTEVNLKHSNIKPNKKYDIRILAFNEAGDGEPSKVLTIKTCKKTESKK